MKKITYQKPTAKVVQLQHRQHLLTDSLHSTRPDYGTVVEMDWE